MDVYRVRQAGHLLMLDNWEEVNAGLIMAAGGNNSSLLDPARIPEKVTLQSLQQESQAAAAAAAAHPEQLGRKPTLEAASNRGREIPAPA